MLGHYKLTLAVYDKLVDSTSKDVSSVCNEHLNYWLPRKGNSRTEIRYFQTKVQPTQTINDQSLNLIHQYEEHK